MKRLILFFLMIPSILFAQEDQRYLAGAVPEEEGKVVFAKTIAAPGLTQEQLYETVLAWSKTHYKDEKNRIAYQSPEEGTLACMGNEYIVFSSSALSLDRTTINYVLRVYCSAGSCEMQLSNIRYEYNVSYQKEPEKYTAEEWITDQFALKKNKLLRIPGKFRKGTIDLTDKLFADATNAINQQVSALASNKVSPKTPPAPAAPITPATPTEPAPAVVPLTPLRPAATPQSTALWNGYKAITPERIPGNIIKLMQDDCMLITASNEQQTTVSSANWGGIGYLLNNPIAFVAASQQEAMVRVIENAGTFTLSFYTETYRDVVSRYKTGRIFAPGALQETGLTPLTTPSGSKTFGEAWMVIECKRPAEAKPLQVQAGTTLFWGDIINVWIK